MTQAIMGYLAAPQLKKAKSRKQEIAIVAQREVDPAQVYLRFDSGRIITFADARHHTVIFGTTGSGKTVSVIYPIIRNAIRAEHAMLIGDLKGTMGCDVRKMARIHGREGDVVEYGCGPLARKVNLLANMSANGIRTFFSAMADENCPDSNGKIWAQKGAHAAADCAILLRWVAEHDEKFEPTLGKIYEMINNPFEASRIYTLFLENYYDKNNDKQRQFVTAVNNNTFHVLKKLERNRRTNEFKSYDGNTSYEEQVTWNLQAIKMGLRIYLEAPGINEHFSASGAPGIDLETDIMAGSIILIRFDSLTGKTGSFLMRLLVSECYKVILRTRIEQRGGKLFHVILDEFQEFADLSDNPGSDKTYAAMGREFGGCLTVATQSESSISCKVGNMMPVESFVGNCNNIISFYSHDASTQQLISRYDEKIKLNKLNPGRLFAVNYDCETRKHLHGVQSVDKAYREMRSLLEGVQLETPEYSDESLCENLPLISLVDGLIENIEREKLEESERQKAELQNSRQQLVNVLAQRREDLKDDYYGDDFDDCEPENDENEDNEMNVMDECDMARTEYSTLSEDEISGLNACVEDGEKVGDYFATELIAEFPGLFCDSFWNVDIPVGWRDFAMKTLRVFKATGMEAIIDELEVVGGNLTASLEGGSSFAQSVLNRMLRPASSLCMICGRKLDKIPGEDLEGREDCNVPICNECFQQYNSPAAESDKKLSAV